VRELNSIELAAVSGSGQTCYNRPVDARSNRQAWLRILAAFAHPDDEVFCAGGTLALHAARGAEVMVVSATQGEAGQIRDAQVATRRTLGSVRAQELQLSCKRLGVQHAVCLDYGDGKLQDSDPLPLTKHLTHIIRSFRPDVVITFGPDGAYGHPDHVAISKLTTRAFHLAGEGAQFPEQLEEGLSPHAPGRLYYSFFPRSRRLLATRLVQWLTEFEQQFHGTIEFAHALLLFAEEAALLGYSSDDVGIQWFPKGFYIIEQGEPATKLYLVLSGQADVIREEADGTQCTRATIGPGEFFGDRGLAYHKPREAHVVAREDVTCMILSPHAPTGFEGRGAGAAPSEDAGEGLPAEVETGATTRIDVSAFVEQKVAALSAYRTQFPLEPEMFPMPMLREVFSCEYFVRAHPPVEMESSLISMSDLLSLRTG
jgi:LmbE family N-acetylglucosaminyl deacetylase